MNYVFDTEPLIAFFYDEPGARDVAEHLREVQNEEATGAISHATAAEIVYKVARLETGDPERATPGEVELGTGLRDLQILQSFRVSIETPSWEGVAGVKAPGGISLGDSYAVALAEETAATLVVGEDPEFDDLPVDVDIYRIR